MITEKAVGEIAGHIAGPLVMAAATVKDLKEIKEAGHEGYEAYQWTNGSKAFNQKLLNDTGIWGPRANAFFSYKELMRDPNNKLKVNYDGYYKLLKATRPRVKSIDPNDIIGPAGANPAPEVGDFGEVSREQDLFYTVEFENTPTATAPAQVVTVTLTLDPNLDPTTVRLADYGFGRTGVTNPSGTSVLGARIAVSATLAVAVNASVNVESGQITWVFRSIDPATLQEVEDPLSGLLPPNKAAPEGQGFISYWVKAKPGLMSSTRINAQARVFFDTNAPLDTPSIYNTIGGTIHLPAAVIAYDGGW
jgi:hypothetical protein